MKKPKKLPRGIYFETAKTRFRVRLYRNNRAYLGGYFKTLPLAKHRLSTLREELSSIKKLYRNQKETRTIHPPTLMGITGAIKEERHLNRTAYNTGFRK